MMINKEFIDEISSIPENKKEKTFNGFSLVSFTDLKNQVLLGN